MIRQTNNKSIEDRLNDILDKINKSGKKSLEDDEKTFLDSFSKGEEFKTNVKMNNKESNSTFLSDDGIFTFIYKRNEYVNKALYIYGKLILPDIFVKNKKIKGELVGDIMVLEDGTISLSFKNGKYDIFEFVSGLEYELDCFIDEIVTQIKNTII